MNVRHPAFDETHEHELMPAFGNFDRAKLSRPIVNVLKKMMMDGAKVRKVETAGGQALGRPAGHQLALHLVKHCWIGDAEPVS